MFGLKIRGVQAPPLDPLLMLVNVMIERSGGYLGGYLFRLKTDSNRVDSTPTRFFSHFSFENSHLSSVTVPRDQGMSRSPTPQFLPCLLVRPKINPANRNYNVNYHPLLGFILSRDKRNPCLPLEGRTSIVVTVSTSNTPSIVAAQI